MATSECDSSVREHFHELLQFVSRYRWVYDVQMTRFVELKWWERIPAEWREPLLQLNNKELNQLPFGLTKRTWPQSLCEFVLQSQRLSLERVPPSWVQVGGIEVERTVKSGMNPKKLHEVGRLAGVVRDMCERTGCTVVLDMGSGLGYLGSCLSQQCGLRVVGLEREETRVASATTRAQPHGSEEERRQPHMSVRSFQLTIDTNPETLKKMTTLLDQIQVCNKGPVGVCMVGLHCCGDLTPTVLRLFASGFHPSLHSLVLLSCCYHKMSAFSKNTAAPSFPLCAVLRGLLSSCGHLPPPPPPPPVNVFALRLAAQETRARWKQQSAADHRDHMRRVAFRGILEAVTRGRSLPRKRLRGIDCTTFTEYADEVSTSLQDPTLRERLLDCHALHAPFLHFIEPFTALQVCMQGVLESLVLLDRQSFLTEHKLVADLVPVFDDNISPRNMALLATRPASDTGHSSAH